MRPGTAGWSRRTAAPGTGSASAPGWSSNTASEESLRCRRQVDDAGGGGDVELVQLTGGELGEAFDGGQEPFDLGFLHQPRGEGAELVDVLLAGERPGAEGVGVGDGDLVGDDGAVLERDLHRAAESLL